MSAPGQESQQEDDFYVGYLDHMPTALWSWLRLVIGILGAIAIVLAAVLAINQDRFDRSYFEFGTIRTWVGTIEVDPAPHLVVTRPGRPSPSGSSPASRYLIVASGKHGAAPQLQEYQRQAVSLRGTLIHRDHEAMIELEEGSVELLPGQSSSELDSTTISIGQKTLRGEIVDSKCYFGVMKPGHGTPHRACASLCIRGGIPPVLAVDEDGSLGYYVVVTDAPILDYVAEPVEVTGEVTLIGDLRVLNATPDGFVRLDDKF